MNTPPTTGGDTEHRSEVGGEPVSTAHSGDRARQTPQRREHRRSEGADGSLDRQVRKRSLYYYEPRSEGANGSLDRQSRKHSIRNEGVEGSLDRQVRKRSLRRSEEAEESLSRQIRKRSLRRSEGAEGSLSRQVRKRSLITHSRESSQSHELRSPSRSQRGINKEARYEYDRRSRTRHRETSQPKRSRRCTRDMRSYAVSSDDTYIGVGRRRRRSTSSDYDDLPTRRLLERRISRPPSRRAHRVLRYDNNNESTNGILNKFLNILNNVKGQTTPRLSFTNVIPEFDPMSKNQTIVMWLTKVEECAEIYGWDERETIHYALPKLTGVAKLWYQGLSTVLFTWTEWKRKLIESFPCRQDYAELLTGMLAKRARYGESLEQYYYTKINVLNRCNITGRRAVDCLLHGVEDRAVRIGAQAARFREPEDVLKYFKTVKPGSGRELGDKLNSERKSTQLSNSSKTEVDSFRKINTIVKCYNCNEDGHKSVKCSKPPAKCNSCSRLGHLDLYCRSKQSSNTLGTSSIPNTDTEKTNSFDKSVGRS